MNCRKDSTLCILFKGDDVSSCIIQKGITGTSYDVLGLHQQPLKSVFIKDHNSSKYLFGFDATHFVDLLQNCCLLNSIFDFLHLPVFGNSSSDSQSGSSKLGFDSFVDEEQDNKLPISHLVMDLKAKYQSWGVETITDLLVCCSMDVYRGYSFLIEEALSNCGFLHVSVIDESTLYACSYLDPLPTKGCVLVILTGKESTFVSCVSFHSNMKPLCVWEEVTSFSEQSVITSLANHLSCSEDIIHLSLPSLRDTERVILSSDSNHSLEESEVCLTSSMVSSVLTDLIPSLQTALIENVSHCENSTKSLLHILIAGTLSHSSFLQHIRSLFPSISVTLIEPSPSFLISGYSHFIHTFISTTSSQEYVYDGEIVQGKRCGFGRLYSFGELIYRGLFKNDKYDGVGEELDEGKVVYRGSYRNGMREGYGELISNNEIIKGQFENGILVEATYITHHPNGCVCYEGTLRNEKRSGIGKVYDEQGLLLYEGCFDNGMRHGLGRLRIGEDWFEGEFLNDVFHNEVKCYDSNHVLRSVYHYENGIRLGSGVEYDAHGCLLYEGGFDENGHYGHGTQYYPGKGIQYEGEFLHGLFHGYGQLYDQAGDLVYIGNFRNGKRDGEGKEYTNETRLLYTGSFKNDKRNGNGKLFFSLGHYYEGNFENGVMRGEGHLVWTDGRCYQGHFEDGIKDGKGVFIWDDGSKYDGLWKNDKRNGHGKQYDAEGALVYEGEWNDDIASGEGILYLKNGTHYEGMVENYRRCGKGIQYSEQGEIEYEGEWKNDVPHGFGRFYYGDGTSYEGSWVNGQKDGTGKFRYGDGRYFIGLFKDGLRNGKGCILNSYGKILHEGVYQSNKEIQ